MTRLSVNINKVALIRNSRGGNLPDLVKIAIDCEKFGAQGITVHPRPDQRHVRFDDIPKLKYAVTTEFNIEGNPTSDFMKLVIENRPHQCTLVPDPPGVLTSNSGWNTVLNQSYLKEVVANLHEHGIRVSLFVDADERMVEAASQTGADRIELYTGTFAHDFYTNKDLAVKAHKQCAFLANNIGLGVNAGHDLNLENLKFYKSNVLPLHEVSIGHALISDALYYGLQNTIQMYKKQLM